MGGKDSKQQAPPPQQPQARAPDKVKSAADNLEGKIADLEKKIDKAEAEAKKYIASGQPTAKARAMNELKKKKQYVDQRDKLLATKMNVEQLQMEVENAQIAKDTVQAMAAANAQLQREKVSVEEVEKITDEVQETLQDMKDVQDALATPMLGQDVDEDELAAELAAMQAQQDEESVLGLLGPAPVVAPVPTAPVVAPAGYTPTVPTAQVVATAPVAPTPTAVAQ
jgi:charged multivesicular body protein 5